MSQVEAPVEPEGDDEPTLAPEVVATLVRNHARFLAFLERRVGSREAAEEILQDAFVRGIARGGALRESESAVAWFYRLLRNALVDRVRREQAQGRALRAAAAEAATLAGAHDTELEATVCACVTDLLPTLRPAYAEALRRVDLEDGGVAELATATGISANNAGVRLHRARQALRRRVEEVCGTCSIHGCVDCTCPPRGGPAALSSPGG